MHPVAAVDDAREMGVRFDLAEPCDFTALICTYNNADLLRSALAHLAAQDVETGVSWEVLVVENNCSDRTHEVVREFQVLGTLPRLRLLSERRQGVGYARRTGMRAASGRLIGLVDDDCLVNPDWISEAIRFADEHPRAGAFGGRNELQWQAVPADFALAYGESLARQDLGASELQLPDVGKQVPCGAGLIVRHDALTSGGWLQHGCLRGRDPRHLGAGEDTEIVLRIRNAAWQVWYSPRLRLTHVIPHERTTLPYLRRLHRGFGRVEVFLKHIASRQQPTWQARWHGLAWSLGEMLAVWRRFWLGYVCYRPERPTWLIRLSYATGCIEGAIRFLITGKGV
jgi:GT2 family glycosyltransferase